MARRRSGQRPPPVQHGRGVQLRLPHARRARRLLRERAEQVGRLRRYQASVVIIARRNGLPSASGAGTSTCRTNVWAVRQNLALIVDHGRAVKGLTRNTHFRWGTRKSQLEYVWRSGVGVDAQGRLIYIAGNNFTLTTLAKAFVQAHAVRAMELDIHNDMVTANLFTPLANGTSGVHGDEAASRPCLDQRSATCNPTSATSSPSCCAAEPSFRRDRPS